MVARWAVIPALRIDYYRLSPKPDSLYRADNPDTPASGLSDYPISPKLGRARLGDAAGLFPVFERVPCAAPRGRQYRPRTAAAQYPRDSEPGPQARRQSNGYESACDTTSGRPVHGQRLLHRLRRLHRVEGESRVSTRRQVTLFQSQNVAGARIYGTELIGRRSGGRMVDGARWAGRRASAAAWVEGRRPRARPAAQFSRSRERLVSLAYESPSGAWGGELAMTAVAAKREVDRSRVDLYRPIVRTLDLLGQ